MEEIDEEIHILNSKSQDTKKAMKKLVCVSFMCVTFMILEFIGGWLASSLAIMTDAAHLLSDLSGFIISVFAIWIGSRPATKVMSYGYHRSEIIGAVASILLIWGLTGWLIYEGIERLMNPVEINGLIMLITASIGLLINISMMKVLHSTGHNHIGHSNCNHGHSHGHSHSHGHGHSHDHSHSHDHHHHHHDDDDHHHHHHEDLETHSTDGSPLIESPHHINRTFAETHVDEEKGDQTSESDEDKTENVNVRAAYIHILGDII